MISLNGHLHNKILLEKKVDLTSKVESRIRIESRFSFGQYDFHEFLCTPRRFGVESRFRLESRFGVESRFRHRFFRDICFWVGSLPLRPDSLSSIFVMSRVLSLATSTESYNTHSTHHTNDIICRIQRQLHQL